MFSNETRIGVLPINIGTPDKPHTPEVRRYLREFLSDPLVVDINPFIRWLLLNLVILPRRPQQSARAYRAIWTEQGSPLLTHSLSMGAQLQESLGNEFLVIPAMRYGTPSISDALTQMREQGVERLVTFPLYPQFAQSSTTSCIQEVNRLADELLPNVDISIVPRFFDDKRVIEAYAAQGRPVLDEFQPDFVLFSFHGLPERHIHKSDSSKTHCLSQANCCDQVTSVNSHCYRAQSFATAREIAAALSLPQSQWMASFQSRLGRTKWIEPYTDQVLDELVEKGIKRLAVFCPAFVADCLETLEEIEIRGKEQFQKAGGEELRLIPSLNACPEWIDAATGLVRETLGISTS